MKKLFLIIALFCLLVIVFIPLIGQASECTGQTGIVKCGQTKYCPCELCDVFSTLLYVYNFIVLDIATPLAVLALTIGGVFILISAGNPTLMSKGKTILYAAIIGLVLVFGSFLIIDFILNDVLGYSMNGAVWYAPEISCAGS